MSKNIKKYLATGLIISGIAITPMLVFAQNNSVSNTGTNTSTTWTAPNFAKLLTITTINGNTVTATDSTGISYTIDISKVKTPKSPNGQIPTLAVSDQIMVVGDLNGTSVQARQINDITYDRTYGPVQGYVTSITGNSFTITDMKGESYTVNVGTSTTYKGTGKHTLNSLSDLKIADHVIVFGTKDLNSKTTSATEVKYLMTNKRGRFVQGDDRGNPGHGVNRGLKKGWDKNGKNESTDTTTDS